MALSNQWRLYISDNNGRANFSGLSELEMSDSAGGSNLCVGGTPISSSDHPTFDKLRAFDGILDFGWLTEQNNPLPSWIGYQFTQPYQIKEFRIIGNEAGLTGGNDQPKDFVLQYFDDNTSSWQDAIGASYTGETGWADYEERVFAGDLTLPLKHTVNGKTTIGSYNVPSSKLIYCHDMVTGELVGSGVSDSTSGKFTIIVEGNNPVFIRAVDPAGIYNTVTVDNIIPEILPII